MDGRLYLYALVTVTAVATVACHGSRPTGPTEVVKTVICPHRGESIPAPGGPFVLSKPPPAKAIARSGEVALTLGVTDWCGVHSDAFRIGTRTNALVVQAGERVLVPNPLPGVTLRGASVVQYTSTEAPLDYGEYLSWSRDHVRNETTQYRSGDRGIDFEASSMTGRHLVLVYVRYDARSDPFQTTDREAEYGFLIDVR